MRCLFIWLSLGTIAFGAMAGPYAPAAGEPGSTAIADDDSRIRGWATGFTDLVRGPQNIKQPAGGLASFGAGSNALGAADGFQSEQFNVVSLGDGGRITLTFAQPMRNGPGADFAVFENGFDRTFLELAFVEVSSNGTDFYRFPSFSLTPVSPQVGSFGVVDATNIHNLAGKYEVGYGVPFDLADLAGQAGLNLQRVTHVRLVDVIGIVDPVYATRDSENRIINDPWATTFESGGFDLDAVAVLNFIPEPASAASLLSAVVLLAARRRRAMKTCAANRRCVPASPAKVAAASRRCSIWTACGLPHAVQREANLGAETKGKLVRERASTLEDSGGTPESAGGTPTLPVTNASANAYFTDHGLLPDKIAAACQSPNPIRRSTSLCTLTRPHASRRAFTLIELLVVVSIIALLAVLVFSAVQSARARGASTQCINNLRTLLQANVAYAADHGGRYCLAMERGNNLRWHGERTGRDKAFDPTKGPLAPYLGREKRIKLCPEFERMLTGQDSFETGSGGYGYNAVYVGGTPANRWEGQLLGRIVRPARTIMFTDCALSRETGIQEYPFSEPWQWVSPNGQLAGALSPSVHFRHQGRANVVWCDGHISAELPTRLGDKNFYGGNDAEHKIGWFGPSDKNGFWNPDAILPDDVPEK